ncbi:unnamed protein product [Ilex paraguariensis]|uniref:Rapid ALkalinization Factor n=1 Tax=Ilex paraguariensis TaxID=185542 RepID=A0ABC8RZZ3_9AQUA
MIKTQPHLMNTLFLVLLLLHTQIKISYGSSMLNLNSPKTFEFDVMVKRVSVGKIGESIEMVAEEEEMDSESNRRVLIMQKRYISYDTLKRDMVPCYKPGASYYNCKNAGEANSYNRGCEVITRCRGVSDINS